MKLMDSNKLILKEISNIKIDMINIKTDIRVFIYDFGLVNPLYSVKLCLEWAKKANAAVQINSTLESSLSKIMDTNNLILKEISKIKLELASKASAKQISALQKNLRAGLVIGLEKISAGWLKKII